MYFFQAGALLYEFRVYTYLITSQSYSVMTFQIKLSFFWSQYTCIIAFVVVIIAYYMQKLFLNTFCPNSRKNTRNRLKIPKKFPDPNKQNLTRTQVSKSLNLGNNSLTWQRCTLLWMIISVMRQHVLWCLKWTLIDAHILWCVKWEYDSKNVVMFADPEHYCLVVGLDNWKMMKIWRWTMLILILLTVPHRCLPYIRSVRISISKYRPS